MPFFNFAHLNSDRPDHEGWWKQPNSTYNDSNDLILSLPKESQGPLALVDRSLKKKLEGDLAIILYVIKFFHKLKLIV